MIKNLIMTIQVNFVKRHKNSPELSLLKFLPLQSFDWERSVATAAGRRVKDHQMISSGVVSSRESAA